MAGSVNLNGLHEALEDSWASPTSTSEPMNDRSADPARLACFPALVPAVALAAILALPGVLTAQVCLGSPNSPGQYSITGDASVSGDNSDFGVGVEANFPGPLGARAGVLSADRGGDDRVLQFEGRVSYDLRPGRVSVCPVTGADFSRRTQDVAGSETTATTLRIPLALSVGGRLGGGDMSFIPSARAGVAHRRVSVEDVTESENSFFVIGGGTLAFDDMHLRAEAGKDTADEDPFFRFQIGIRR